MLDFNYNGLSKETYCMNCHLNSSIFWEKQFNEEPLSAAKFKLKINKYSITRQMASCA